MNNRLNLFFVLLVCIKSTELLSMELTQDHTDQTSFDWSTYYFDLSNDFYTPDTGYTTPTQKNNPLPDVADIIHNGIHTLYDYIYTNISDLNTSERIINPDKSASHDSPLTMLFKPEIKQDSTINIEKKIDTQIKVERILSSVINNPDHGMQAAIDLALAFPKVKVNDQNNPTETSPLHFAARWNAYKLGAILITQGANINSQDINGQTPLHILALYNNDANNEFTKILLYAEAHLYIKNKNGKTAAKIALELEKINLYNMIIEATQLRLIN